MTYETGKKVAALPNEMHRLGKALARGTLKSVAEAAFQNPKLKPHIEDLVLKDVSRECKSMCSLRQPSILRSIGKEALVKFSWARVSDEFKTKAPLFYRVLLAGTGKSEDSPAVTSAAAIVLKERDKAMSLVQYVTGLLLKMGKISKQVIQ